MCISEPKPSSVILSQTKWFKKLNSDAKNMPKQAEVKRGGVIKPQFQTISNTENFDDLKRYESTEAWLHAPSGILNKVHFHAMVPDLLKWSR